MKVNPHIFRGYDLRGIVNEDLTPEIVEHLGKAHGTYLKRAGISKAVVGYDARATSPEYSQAIIRGLTWAGLDVINIGMHLVGTFYWAQHYLKCQGGVYVTASHNPAEYNGFKFANDYSETLVSESIQELRKMVEDEDYEQGDKPGVVEEQDISEVYFSYLVERLSVDKKFKVVVDTGHSTAGASAAALLKKFGCDVVEQNTKVDPTFPLGAPDPIDSEMAERLSAGVVKAKADLGFSFDSDGDRIGLVDEQGGIIYNDVLLAIFAMDVLQDHPGDTIMYNTLCSKVVKETIETHKGKPFMWRTGHSFLKKKNQEVKGAFIGELSGHFFFSADYYNHDDGLYSMIRVLQYLSRVDKPLSEIVQSLPQYISSPEIKVYAADDKKVALIEKLSPILKKDYPTAEVIDDERAGDGLRLELDTAMFVVRYSQNGPYITIKFEAKAQEEYDKLREYISTLLHSFEEIDWNSDINVNTEAFN
ncbi:MAG: phosphomannomutase/phosphoglucomutase [Candidatus Komeilibacteria bacterium]|jgi:phosphomannomutase / phosphoglucomutase|nr:phosphomannomutase/phosphoglucomutase [Candidatus Komeilibacteria bacterium]MBT4447544.1 phosphomannomutase/phosphoglucomutase [Candidatus Komeilibacteria bacterium]